MTRKPRRTEPRPPPRRPEPDDLVASPPDDGGHLGDLTRPEDTMQRPDPGPERRWPALDTDVTGSPSSDHSPAWLWIVLAVAVAAIAFFLFLRL